MNITDDFFTPEERAKISRLSEIGVEVYWLSGLCPMQSQGWIHGHPYYFKARGDEWFVQIANQISPNIELPLESDDYTEYGASYGVFPDAGYMPFIEALGFIEQSAKQWRESR